MFSSFRRISKSRVKASRCYLDKNREWQTDWRRSRAKSRTSSQPTNRLIICGRHYREIGSKSWGKSILVRIISLSTFFLSFCCHSREKFTKLFRKQLLAISCTVSLFARLLIVWTPFCRKSIVCFIQVVSQFFKWRMSFLVLISRVFTHFKYSHELTQSVPKW